jgi:hypothetical protein
MELRAGNDGRPGTIAVRNPDDSTWPETEKEIYSSNPRPWRRCAALSQPAGRRTPRAPLAARRHGVGASYVAWRAAAERAASPLRSRSDPVRATGSRRICRLFAIT